MERGPDSEASGTHDLPLEPAAQSELTDGIDNCPVGDALIEPVANIPETNTDHSNLNDIVVEPSLESTLLDEGNVNETAASARRPGRFWRLHKKVKKMFRLKRNEKDRA